MKKHESSVENKVAPSSCGLRVQKHIDRTTVINRLAATIIVNATKMFSAGTMDRYYTKRQCHHSTRTSRKRTVLVQQHDA